MCVVHAVAIKTESPPSSASEDFNAAILAPQHHDHSEMMDPVKSSMENRDTKRKWKQTAPLSGAAKTDISQPVPQNCDDYLSDDPTAPSAPAIDLKIDDKDEVNDVSYASFSSQGAPAPAPDGGHRRQEKRSTKTKSKRSTTDFAAHKSKDFVLGRILKVFWFEPRGSQHQNPSTIAINRVTTPGKIRRFVIVETHKGHSTCVPISTYGFRGTKKPGCHAQDHAMIYSGSLSPNYLPGEDHLPNPKIKASLVGESLARESRINFAKKYTIEHDFHVNFIGEISKESSNDFWKTYDRINSSIQLKAGSPAPNLYFPASPYAPRMHMDGRAQSTSEEQLGTDGAKVCDFPLTPAAAELLEEATIKTWTSGQNDSADPKGHNSEDSEEDKPAENAEEQPSIDSEPDMLIDHNNEEETHWFYKVQTASNSDALPKEPRVGDPLMNEGTEIIVASEAESRMSLHASGMRHRTGFSIVAARPDVEPRPVLPLHNPASNTGSTTYHFSSASTAHRETEEYAATVSAETVSYYFTFCMLLFSIIGTLGVGVQALTVVSLLKEVNTDSYIAPSWWDNNFLQTLSGSCWQVLGISFTVALTLKHISEHHDSRDWKAVWTLCGVCFGGSFVSIGVYKMSSWSSHFAAGISSLAQVYVHFLAIRILQKVEVRQKCQEKDIVDSKLEHYRADGKAKIDDELRCYETSMQGRRDSVFEAIILLEKRKTQLEIEVQRGKMRTPRDSAYGSGGEVTDESRSSCGDSADDGGCL